MDQQKDYLWLITSQLKCFAYNIVKENRISRKGEELACLYKDDLTGEEIKGQKSHIWSSVTKIKDFITQTVLGIDL